MEKEWSIVWTVEMKCAAANLLQCDLNSIIVISTEGNVDKLVEEKSTANLSHITSLKRYAFHMLILYFFVLIYLTHKNVLFIFFLYKNISSVVEKCVFINPRGNYLMLQTNLSELLIVHAESGVEVLELAMHRLFPVKINIMFIESYPGDQIFVERCKLYPVT